MDSIEKKLLKELKNKLNSFTDKEYDAYIEENSNGELNSFLEANYLDLFSTKNKLKIGFNR